jgi:hypothetical protein
MKKFFLGMTETKIDTVYARTGLVSSGMAVARLGDMTAGAVGMNLVLTFGGITVMSSGTVHF